MKLRAQPHHDRDDDGTDIRVTIDRFLVALYEEQRRGQYAAEVDVALLATQLPLPEALAEKIAAYLESEGLADFDKDLLDITVEGILHAERILREARAPKPDAPSPTTPRKAR